MFYEFGVSVKRGLLMFVIEYKLFILGIDGDLIDLFLKD